MYRVSYPQRLSPAPRPSKRCGSIGEPDFMRSKTSAFQYLLECSQMSLEDFELARLDRASNLRKQMRDIGEEWVEVAVQAQLARWVRENRHTSDVRGRDDRPRRSSRSLPASDGGNEVDFSSARNALAPFERPCPSRPKRAVLAPTLPAPLSVSTRQRSPRTSARAEPAPELRDQTGTQIERVLSSPEDSEMRPDAFAAVRHFRRSPYSR
jgi:hypothetical protein